ncbi:MAG: hypothetical protein IT290_04710, partial [Deltaproteobacteria bacterium]|nr:hypothetical protein [Deltaproteobacteria bacterium]
LQNGYQDCTNSPECRVCAPGVCCDDSYSLVQSPPSLGTAEVCNGRDDNCDVTVDEGGVCTGGVCSGGWGFYDDGNTYKQRWSQILSDDIR